MAKGSRRDVLRHGAAGLLGWSSLSHSKTTHAQAQLHRRLYVATPGIRDYLEYGGHGLLVFDIDNDHKFLKRVATKGLDAAGKPLNVKGICTYARTGRVYVSTIKQLMCLDLVTDKLLWERVYEAGCDRMSITPDGKTIYLPSLEGPLWNVVDAEDGAILTTIVPDSGAHNTIAGLDNREVYLAGLRSPLLTVAGVPSKKAERTIGPFSAPIRPFTINGRQNLVFVNVNGLLGFEIGDLKTGAKLHRVEVKGYEQGPIKRHGCPSHGIGLTPPEDEVWLADAHNQCLHIFDLTTMPPKQKLTIKLKDEPGWVTFSRDGDFAYPSTGEVIEVSTKRIVTELRDETGQAVQSEKMLEIDFRDLKPWRNGDQFGLGQIGAPDGISP
jgi:hypothetical protein